MYIYKVDVRYNHRAHPKNPNNEMSIGEAIWEEFMEEWKVSGPQPTSTVNQTTPSSGEGVFIQPVASNNINAFIQRVNNIGNQYDNAYISVTSSPNPIGQM